LHGSLPGIRIRAFVRSAEPAPREVPMVLDTLFADLDWETVTLTWRGVTSVREDDLSDVKTVLIASEKLEDERLPEAHYRSILEAFERDPTGIGELRKQLGSFAEGDQARIKEAVRRLMGNLDPRVDV